jgi:uncharacterized protein YicC (UPF0701 family)
LAAGNPEAGAGKSRIPDGRQTWKGRKMALLLRITFDWISLERKLFESSQPCQKGEPMEEKTAYQEKYEAKLKEWKAKIDQLEARAEQAKADAKIDYQEKIKELKAQEKTARSKLEEIKKSGSAAWKDLKGGLEKAGDELNSALDKAVSKFK